MTSQRTLSTILATALLLWLLLPLRAASARHWIAKASQDGIRPTLYVLPGTSRLVSAEDFEEDGDREISVVVPTLVESPPRPVPVAWTPLGARPAGNVRPPMNKRQVRYHQCYFNPISCFG